MRLFSVLTSEMKLSKSGTDISSSVSKFPCLSIYLLEEGAGRIKTNVIMEGD